MGRNRKKDKGLPSRVYVDCGKVRKDGTRPRPIYYLKRPDGKRYFLGNTEFEMRRNHLAIMEVPGRIEKMGELIDDYMLTVAPQKGESTYILIAQKIKFIRAFFKNLYPCDVTAPEIYRYMDIRAEKKKIEKEVDGKKITQIVGGKRTANQERTILSDIFNHAIRKGIVKDNPVRNVKPFSVKARDRYPEDGELKAVYNEASDILKCILDFAYLSGQRRGDILFIQEPQITDEGIRITQEKTKGKVNTKLLIQWSPALKECVNRARKLRGSIRSMYLFCKEDGQPYKFAGLRSMYNRAMDKALEKGILKERFNFHDIRAKTYSDDEDDAQKIKRAGHVDASMGRVYDRKVKKVKPLK